VRWHTSALTATSKVCLKKLNNELRYKTIKPIRIYLLVDKRTNQ